MRVQTGATRGLTSSEAALSALHAMMAGSHVLIGMLAWEWVAPRLGLNGVRPDGVILSAIGALLPDIDHPRSWTGRRTWPVSAVIARLAGHRGATHSLVSVFACSWLLHRAALSSWVVAPLVTGYLSHLGGDLVTPAGLRLAWPLRRTFSLPLCRTGGVSEIILVGAILAAAMLVAAGCGRAAWHCLGCCFRMVS